MSTTYWATMQGIRIVFVRSQNDGTCGSVHFEKVEKRSRVGKIATGLMYTFRIPDWCKLLQETCRFFRKIIL